MLQEQPSLLETVGPLALTMATTYFGTLDAVKFLLEQGVDQLYDTQTSIPRKHTHEPISGAFEYGNFETLRTLFAAGITDAAFADLPWIAWPHKTTLLHMSIYRPRSFAEFALEHGADLEEPLPNGERGATVLQAAVAPPDAPGYLSERWAMGMRFADFLLDRGAYYDIFSACGRGDIERMQALAGEEPGLITRRGNAAMTPLHWAVRGNALPCAEWLLSKGADVDAVTETQRTPKHIAAEWNLGEMLWLLADYGAHLDAADLKGRTPLHRATYIGQAETAEILIVLGADIDRQNNRGKTPLDIARKACGYLRPHA